LREHRKSFLFYFIGKMKSEYEKSEVCLCQQLGCGSCSAVYEGTDPKCAGTIAVKVFPKDRAQHAYHEYDMLKRVRHPGCVTPFALRETTSGEVYLLMELVRGPDMVALLKRCPQGVVSEASAQKLMKGVLRAIHYLHTEAKIVHMDVKLENLIVLTDTWEVKLIDFHLSKRFDEKLGDLVHDTPRSCDITGMSELSPRCYQKKLDSPISGPPSADALCHCDEKKVHATHHHHTDTCKEHGDCQPFHCSPCGSLKYAPPEVIAHIIKSSGPRLVTWPELQKVDTFGVGVVTFGLLTGRFPFHGVDKTYLLHQMKEGPRLRGRHFEKCSKECLDFIRQLLHPEVEHRLTAAEALHHPWITMEIEALPTLALRTDSSAVLDDALSTPSTTPMKTPQRGDDEKSMRRPLRMSFEGLDRNEKSLQEKCGCKKGCVIS
jgi:serine/threonine protein kinase